MNNESNGKERIMIVILCISIMLAIAFIAFVVFYNLPAQRLKRNITQGDKYLNELEYEDAILAYRLALEIDSKSEEAYIGLAEAYLGLKDFEKAYEIVKHGLEVVRDSRELNVLLSKIEKEMEKNDANTKMNKTKEETEDSSKGEMESVDYESVYDEYLRSYGIDRGIDPKFEYIYINDDDIPELAIADGFGHPDKVNIYMISGNSIIDLGGVGWFGSFEYIDHGNMVHEETTYFGDLINNYYTINGTVLELISSFSDYIGTTDEEIAEGTEEFRVNDHEVTKEEYERRINSLSGNYKICGYDENMRDLREYRDYNDPDVSYKPPAVISELRHEYGDMGDYYFGNDKLWCVSSKGEIVDKGEYYELSEVMFLFNDSSKGHDGERLTDEGYTPSTLRIWKNATIQLDSAHAIDGKILMINAEEYFKRYGTLAPEAKREKGYILYSDKNISIDEEGFLYSFSTVDFELKDETIGNF